MKFIRVILLSVSGLMIASLWAADDYPVRPVPFTDVKVSEGFWYDRLATNREVTVWYDFKKCEETGRIDNFAKAGKMMPGNFRGTPFDDSDVFKVIEGAAYCLAQVPDPKLDKYLDDLIAKIAAAQEPDGYLYTARTIHPDNPPGIAGPKRWINDCGGVKGQYGDSHELYNVGHLYEAAVAHYQTTGKRTLLDVAIKSADLITSLWGPGKLEIPSGHQEIELALVKLYRVTGKREYLELSHFITECRGRGHGNATKQYSNHLPVVEQKEMVGHSVRAAYMLSGMADIAAVMGDTTYRSAVDTIWSDMIRGKMALTGGLGARHGGEAMGEPYELPNFESYNETCAAIANVFWNHRMFLLSGDGKYLDVLERAVYNGAVAGVSLSGNTFFYVNPLAADGAWKFNKGYATRFPWTGCACCPVNVVRFIPSVPGYGYATREESLYVGFYLPGVVETEMAGRKIRLEQTTEYPWQGRVQIKVAEGAGKWEMKLRIPGWAVGKPVPSDLYRYVDAQAGMPVVKVNGKEVELKLEQGFVGVERNWRVGDSVELELPMVVRRVAAHDKVEACQGHLAVERGPLVYCLEGADNASGVHQLVVPAAVSFTAEHRPELLGGVTVLRGEAQELYRDETGAVHSRPAAITAIPYNVWCHRGANPMAVWLPTDEAQAVPLPYPTLASRAKVTASHTHSGDTTAALNDQREPANSNDHALPRFTWWDHKGSKEWVQYTFDEAQRISSAAVYWFDDERSGGRCRVPQAWRLTYYDGNEWLPVKNASAFGVEQNKFNKVTFDTISSVAFRLEVELQPGFSGGILEWSISD